MNTIPTPRTDEKVELYWSEGNSGMGSEYSEELVKSEFCRQLERELAIERDSNRLYKVEVDNLAMLLDGADSDRKSLTNDIGLLKVRCDQLIEQLRVVDLAFLEQKYRADTLQNKLDDIAYRTDRE
jgi:hypothetical protein